MPRLIGSGGENLICRCRMGSQPMSRRAAKRASLMTGFEKLLSRQGTNRRLSKKRSGSRELPLLYPVQDLPALTHELREKLPRGPLSTRNVEPASVRSMSLKRITTLRATPMQPPNPASTPITARPASWALSEAGSGARKAGSERARRRE